MNFSNVTKYFYPHRILDIGANTGQFHQQCRAAFPDSYIFSIEASPNCEPQLKNVTSNYYIGLLAKDNKTYDFYTRKGDPTSTSNSIHRELTPFFSDDQIEIKKRQGVPLDNLFTEDSKFDLIKIDTQGSELDIISGGMTLCKQAEGIMLEVSLVPYNEGSPLKDEVLSFMDNIGFYPAEELGYNHHPITGELIQIDLLFLKKKQ